MHAVNNAAEKFVPMKCCRLSSLKKTGVHYPQYIKRMQNYKAFLRKKWKRSKRPADKNTYHDAANILLICNCECSQRTGAYSLE